MSQSTRILLNRTPSILNLYRRALFAKGLKGSTPKLPTKRITLANAQADTEKVSQYQNICGFKQNNNTIYSVNFLSNQRRKFICGTTNVLGVLL